MFCMLKKKIYPAYVSKNNSNREKQVILLMIPNREKREAKSGGREANIHRREAKSKGQRWHYLAVKKLSALLRGVSPKHHGDFCCLNYLHSFATEKKK